MDDKKLKKFNRTSQKPVKEHGPRMAHDKSVFVGRWGGEGGGGAWIEAAGLVGAR